MEFIETPRTRPSLLRRFSDGVALLGAALELSELDLMQLRVARLTNEVADLKRAVQASAAAR